MALKQLVTVHGLLFASFLFLLSSCTPPPTPPHETRSTLYIYRFDPPAFVEYSAGFQPVDEIPFHLPPDCGLYNTFPAPIGPILLIELSCPGGQTVLFLDASSAGQESTVPPLSAGSASVTQPVTDADAHFLAWASDGQSVYLKVDSLGNPRVVRAETDGDIDVLSAINEFTYDLAVNPVNDDLIFTFSRGLGYGSELHSTQYAIRNTKALYADPFNYISFARFSPDGEKIAFIKTPDTQTPFTVGELWVMDADGTHAHKLADADAGHGFAANWSPDGKRIAFVVRDNLENESANQSSEALVGNIFVINIETRALKRITQFVTGHAETPFWSPDGNTLVFGAVIDGRMNVFTADVSTASVGMPDPTGSLTPVEIQPLETGSACCPAWMRK